MQAAVAPVFDRPECGHVGHTDRGALLEAERPFEQTGVRLVERRLLRERPDPVLPEEHAVAFLRVKRRCEIIDRIECAMDKNLVGPTLSIDLVYKNYNSL